MYKNCQKLMKGIKKIIPCPKPNFESENVQSSPRILIILNYGQTVCGQFLSSSRDKAAFKFMKAQMFEGRGVLLLIVTLAKCNSMVISFNRSLL